MPGGKHQTIGRHTLANGVPGRGLPPAQDLAKQRPHPDLPQPGTSLCWQHPYPYPNPGHADPLQGTPGIKAGRIPTSAQLDDQTHTQNPTPLVDEICAALKAQTVIVPGSDAAELVIPQLAANIKALKQQRGTIAEARRGDV